MAKKKQFPNFFPTGNAGAFS